MASTREVKNAVDKPVAEQPEKVVKEKKAKAPKEKKKPAKNASHPPYFQMIKEALLALNEKGGSSPHAIAKYMEEKHKAVLPESFRKMLALQLKNSASKGKLTKVKASYKLCGNNKPSATDDDATKKPKKTTTKKTSAPAKKQAPAKKMTPAKKRTPAKAKQPKSIKSPAAVKKKARKATA